MSSPDWFHVLKTQVWAIPYLSVYFAGIVAALITWRRHPPVSTLALLGFGLLLVNVLVGCGLHVWMILGDGDISERAQLHAVLSFLRSLAAVLAHALVIAAIFGWRKSDRKIVEKKIPDNPFAT